MKTSEVLSNLLRQHNVFLTNTTTFDIYGLFKETVEKKDSDDDNSIAEKIVESTLIHKVERTGASDTRGIQTVIVKKANEKAAKEFLEGLAPNCTMKQDKHFGLHKKLIAIPNGNNMGEVVNTYANWLEKLRM